MPQEALSFDYLSSFIKIQCCQENADTFLLFLLLAPGLQLLADRSVNT